MHHGAALAVATGARPPGTRSDKRITVRPIFVLLSVNFGRASSPVNIAEPHLSKSSDKLSHLSIREDPKDTFFFSSLYAAVCHCSIGN
jgi:hypothetical protein